MRIWRGEGPIREKVANTWQSRLFRGGPNPTQDAFQFWETVQTSLDYRNIAYIWKSKDATGRVIMLWALHPDQVSPQRAARSREIVYTATFPDNFVCPMECDGLGSVTVDSSTILRIVGRGGMGQLIPSTPIALFRSSLANIIAKQDYESALYANGALGGLGVEFPAGVSKDQADKWREGFDSTHAGVKNAGRTKVVGGGAKLQQIGMTQRDAQFVEAANLSVMDVSRIFRVPAWFLGVTQATDKPITPEHEQQRWLQHGLNPRMTRIESAINADPDLFPAYETYAGFDTAGMVRGDLATEAEISHKKVQAGIWLPDEARAKDGLPPLPDGVGMIPQIVPVGGAPNPNAK
jgi:HK97 family phage portal protein